jgi:hypothetical protein
MGSIEFGVPMPELVMFGAAAAAALVTWFVFSVTDNHTT